MNAGRALTQAAGGPSLLAVERLGTRDVAGIDLTGFSAWVEARLADEDGLEAAADATAAMLAELGAVLRAHGFRPAFSTGDGLVAVADDPTGPRIADALARDVRRLEPAARIACARGELCRALVPGLHGMGRPLLFGDGVAAVHALLGAAPRVRGLARAARAAQGAAKLGGAALVPQVVGCLGAPLEALGVLAARLPAWEAEAAASGGRFGSLAHDDAGLLLRFDWPAAASAPARAMLATAASQLGEGAGAGVAEGLVFHSGGIACGAAINTAAKAAKRGARVAAEPVPMPPARSALVGREAEIARLDALLDEPGAPVRLVGAPGMGKSVLLAELAGRAPAILVAARPSACLDSLGLWGAALDAARGPGAWAALAAQADAEGAGSPAARLAARADALLAALAGHGRLLFDDAQWADADSLRLAARAAAAGMPVLLGTRPDGRAPDARTLELGPLPPAAIEAMMRAAGGRAARAALAAGNPLHAVLLSYTDNGEASLDAVLDARVAALSGEALAAMRLLAIADRAVPDAAWARLAGRLALGDPRVALAAGAFIERTADGAAPAHRLLAERVLDQTPPSVMRQLHWAVAAAARAGWLPGARPGETAGHWAAAGAYARAAVGFARDAEAALAAGGFDAAARLFDAGLRAHARLPDAPVRRAALAGGLGMARWAGGDARAARTAADGARAAIDRALRGHGSMPGGGRFGLLLLAGRRLRPRLRAAVQRLAVLDAELGYFRGDMRAYAAGGLVALAIGGDARGAALIKARGLSGLSVLLGMLGFTRLATLPAAWARRHGGEAATAVTDAGEAIWRAARADWTGALAALDRVEAARPELFDSQLAAASLCLRGLVEQMRGRLDAASAAFAALEARAGGNIQARAWALYGAAMPMVARAQGAAALAAVRDAQRVLADNDDRLSDLNCLALLARAALLEGDRDAALAAAHEAAALAGRLQPVNFGSLEGFTGAALVAGALAGDPRAAVLLPQAMKQARRFARVFPIGRPRLALARALVARDPAMAQVASGRAAALGMEADAALAAGHAERMRCRPI